MKPAISPTTLAKILITGEATHPDLSKSVKAEMLPKLYGGLCECEATCIYSDKGPWCQVENKVNYQDREGNMKKAKVQHQKGQGGAGEAFKFEGSEDDDEVEDLLGRESQMADLKSALLSGFGQGPQSLQVGHGI